jgi:hypothetical protein
MHRPNLFNIATLLIANLMTRSPLRRGWLLIALTLTCLAFSPMAKAVDPQPDGGYPNQNTAEGDNALFSLTNGTANTAIGFEALFSNTTGINNTANGVNALFSNQTGQGNTATGFQALFSNTTGSDNTAIGINALLSNTTGGANTANGTGALKQNTAGSSNTANGYRALYSNTTGGGNTANGVGALNSNTIGTYNTASGINALYSNTTGNANTATGVGALRASTGANNTANGFQALVGNTTGKSNIAVGFKAGENLTTGSNNIDIGNVGSAGESNTIRIGTKGSQTNTFIAGISGVTVAGGVGVIVDSSGHLGTVQSSERFKGEIKPMDTASEAILALQPVTFRYKHELDPDGVPQFGLVAEQVEKVNPDLVVRGEDGKVMTVRYEAVNAMLLNEFLKEHRNVAEQQSTIADLKTTVALQQKQIEALTATVRKVSDQISLSKPSPQFAANP